MSDEPSFCQTLSKRLRLYGLNVEIHSTKNKLASNFSTIVLTTPDYFKSIALYLSFVANSALRNLSSFHNSLFKNKTHQKWLKELLLYDLTQNIDVVKKNNFMHLF